MQDNNQPQTLIPKKNNNTGLIIALIASISVIAIMAVVLIIVLTTTVSKDEDKEEEKINKTEQVSLSVLEEIATQQEDDISRFMTAANDYQSNNNGSTPWRYGYTNAKFVKRYIDADCSKETPEETDETCGEYFRDPLDNKPYHFEFKEELTADKKAVVSNNHGISVYTNARCGENGYVLKATGVRQYALLYRLANETIGCNDNH